MGILTTQLLEEVQAGEETGDEVVTGRGQAQAAAFQLADALQQTTVEELLSAPGDLGSEGPFKTGAEVLPSLAVQKKGEALRGGGLFQQVAEG